MRENSFLSDFFGCMGFLPLTTRSNIRETMVNIMLHPAPREQPAIGEGSGEVGRFDGCATIGGFGNTVGGEGLLIGPSICIFWCAVALGALVKGSPIESVAIYTQRATDALAQSHSGPADAELAQAWANLAYLYGFMGNSVKFQEYLTLSEAYLTATIEQGSADRLPVGLAEIIQDRGKAETSSNMESFCSREYHEPPQLNGILTEHEVYRYVQQSFRVYEQALYSKILNKSPLDYECGAEPIGEDNGGQPHQHDVPQQQQQFVDAIFSVWFKDNNVVRFKPLREIVDRPSIRAGVGGMIINGCIGFQAAGEGETRITLMRFSRCVEVFARYPGLCRFPWLGAHKAHTVLAGLAALDVLGAREEYQRLRAAYNSSRPHGFPPAPPLEEWQGMSAICDDFHCRAFEGLLASGRVSAFSATHNRNCTNKNYEIEGENGFVLPGLSQHGKSAASIIPTQEAFTSAGRPSGSSETESGLHGTCSGNGETEHSLEFTGVDKAPTACATSPNCHQSKLNLDEDDAASDIDVVHVGDGESSVSGFVAAPREATLVTLEELSGEAINDTEREFSAADWLDVTDALLAGVSESGQACG
eukprot:g4587.t1